MSLCSGFTLKGRATTGDNASRGRRKGGEECRLTQTGSLQALRRPQFGTAGRRQPGCAGPWFRRTADHWRGSSGGEDGRRDQANKGWGDCQQRSMPTLWDRTGPPILRPAREPIGAILFDTNGRNSSKKRMLAGRLHAPSGSSVSLCRASQTFATDHDDGLRESPVGVRRRVRAAKP